MPKEALTGPNKLEVHEVILDSSRPGLDAERRADIHEAFLQLGCALICLKALQICRARRLRFADPLVGV